MTYKLTLGCFDTFWVSLGQLLVNFGLVLVVFVWFGSFGSTMGWFGCFGSTLDSFGNFGLLKKRDKKYFKFLPLTQPFGPQSIHYHVPCFSLHDNCPEIFALVLKSASLFHGHELLFSMRWRGYLQQKQRTKNARMAFEI